MRASAKRRGVLWWKLPQICMLIRYSDRGKHVHPLEANNVFWLGRPYVRVSRFILASYYPIIPLYCTTYPFNAFDDLESRILFCNHCTDFRDLSKIYL